MRFSRGTRLAACLLALSISLPGGLARAAESAESPLTLTEGQSVTLTLEAPQTGEYRLELEFMALTGKTYREILAWYYPGTSLSSAV